MVDRQPAVNGDGPTTLSQRKGGGHGDHSDHGDSAGGKQAHGDGDPRTDQGGHDDVPHADHSDSACRQAANGKGQPLAGGQQMEQGKRKRKRARTVFQIFFFGRGR